MSPAAHLDENDAIRVLLDPEDSEAGVARRHLDGCEACRELVAAVAKLVISGGEDAGPTQGWAESVRLQPGTEIGVFRVVEQIGQGAMGAVYLATDMRLQRRVALKLLSAGVADDTALARLRREARSMARLHHPNVVEVLDVGRGPYGPFVAMQFVDGADLGRWVAETQRPLEEILHKLRLAGQGLAAAHAAGIVHRDFKPANVMVGRDGSVCVADFGLAVRRNDASRLHEHVATQVQGAQPDDSASGCSRASLAGTPAYMAPELLYGGEAGPSSDQFAFCVTAFEALSGHRPFDETSVALRMAAIGDGRIRKGNPAVPRHVASALARGLQADPSQRFSDMTALLSALRKPQRSAFRWIAGAALIAVVAEVVVLAGTGPDDPCAELPSVLPWDETSQAELMAVWNDTGVDAPTTARLVDTLGRYAAQWAEARHATCEQKRSAVPVDPQTPRCLARLRREFSTFVTEAAVAQAQHAEGFARATNKLVPVQRCRDGRVSHVRDPVLDDRMSELRTHYRSARARGAQEELHALRTEVAALIKRATRNGDTSVQAEATVLLGVLYSDARAYHDAEPWFERAFMVARAAGHERLVFDAALARTVLSALDPRRLADSWTWARHARAALDSEHDNEGRVRLLTHEASLHLTASDMDQAGAVLREAEGWLDEDLPAHVHMTLYSTLGEYHARLDEQERCRDAFAKAVAHGSSRLGPDHSELVRPLNGLAMCEIIIGEHDNAQRHLRQAISIAERVGRDLVAAAAYGNLGLLYRNLDQPTPSLAALLHADELFAAAFPQEHPMRVRSFENLAAAYLAVGEYDTAVVFATRVSNVVAELPDLPSQSAYGSALVRASAQVLRGDRGLVATFEALIREAPSENYKASATIGLLQAMVGQQRDAEVVRIGAALYRDDAPLPAISELRYAEGRMLYAQALGRRGERAEARRQLELALSLVVGYEQDDPRGVVSRIRRELERS